MHLQSVSNATQLSQGSIFSLKGLSFTHKGVSLTLSDFYPKVRIDGIQHGIVLSQSCDLVTKDGRKPKIPYITVGFLEPLSRYIQRDKAWERAAIPWTLQHKDESIPYTFISPDFLRDALRDKFSALLKNEDNCHFFVLFDEEKEDPDRRYCIVNLTKAVPIRIEHYNEICPKVTYELTTQFANKLGWKIAELYGRVGTDDFDKAGARRILNEFQDMIDRELTAAVPSPPIRLKEKDFRRAEKLRNSGEPERQRFIVEILNGQEQPEVPSIKVTPDGYSAGISLSRQQAAAFMNSARQLILSLERHQEDLLEEREDDAMFFADKTAPRT